MANPSSYIFSGSSTRRPPINLGGQQRNPPGNSQAELIRRAKHEREEREAARLQERAAVKLQVSFAGEAPEGEFS